MLKRVLVLDDNQDILDVVQETLSYEKFEVISTAESDKVMSLVKEFVPDLILLDLSMPGTTGLLGAYRVRAAAPRSALVIVSAHDDPRIVGGAISLGISGYIPKSTPKLELARLLRGILEGAVCLPTRFRDTATARKAQAETRELVQQLGQFTAQQLRVLDMICRGLQNKHVAYELDISVTTVKVHVSEILRKLGVRSRTEAIIALSKLDFGKHDHAPVTASPSSHGD